MPSRGSIPRKFMTRAGTGISPLTETFRDYFFRPQNLVAPEKAAFYPHDDLAVFLGEISRLETDHLVQRTVDGLFRLDLAYFHPMQDFRQRVDRVLQIVAPLAKRPALAGVRFDGGLEL